MSERVHSHLKAMFRLFYSLAVFCLILSTVRLPIVGISISDFFILCALVVLVAETLLARAPVRWGWPVHALYGPAFLVLVGGLLSSVMAVHPTTSFAISIKLWFVLTVWISMTMVMARRYGVVTVLSVYVAAVLVTSLVAVSDRVTGVDIGGRISGREVAPWNRSDGTVGQPVELGLMTTVALPLVLGLLVDEAQRRRRARVLIGLGMTFAVILTTTFLTGSVAAWLASGLVLGLFGVILVVRSGLVARFGVALALLLFAGVASVYMMRPGAAQQAEGFVTFNLQRVTNLSGPGRIGLMVQAIDYIARNPFIGAGMDQTGTGELASSELVTSDLVHNPILGGWLGGGLLAFIGLVACYAITFLTMLNALHQGLRHTDWLVVGLALCVLGWLVFDQAQPHLYHRYTWLTLAMLFSLGLGVRLPWSQRARSSPPYSSIPVSQSAS